MNNANDFDNGIKAAVKAVKDHDEKYDWVGVYLYRDGALQFERDHYLGAITTETTIELDAGICGAAATARETIIVDDVKHDERYITCSITVQSEIVVPILAGGELVGVLDLDSDTHAAFDEKDKAYLESIAANIAAVLT